MQHTEFQASEVSGSEEEDFGIDSTYFYDSNLGHLISKACFFFSNSVVNVHVSQAYRNMEMTRERISFTFDPRIVVISPNGLQLCKSRSGLCNHVENLWFGAII